MRELDGLKKENEYRERSSRPCSKPRIRAETQAEERRREKEILRARSSAQKESPAVQERLVAQLGAKISDLRAPVRRAQDPQEEISPGLSGRPG